MGKNKSKRQPYEPTIEELSGAPKAFEYELQMFLSAFQVFQCLKNPCSILVNDCLRNAILETVLLHVRNLLEFFAGDHPLRKNRDEDSIRAGYFVGQSHKNEKGWWKSSKLQHTKSRKNDINKSLSHLTFRRIEENYKWDDLPEMKKEIEAAYSEFIELLPKEDRAKWPPPVDFGKD